RSGELVRDTAGGLVGLAEQQRGLDRVLHFLEGLGVSRFLVEDLDDVEAVFGLHEVRNRAFRKRKRRVLEFFHGLTAFQLKGAALVLGARVLGVLLDEIFKLGAGLLRLLQYVLSLLFDFGDFGVGLADGHQQNVLYLDTVGHLVLLNVALI